MRKALSVTGLFALCATLAVAVAMPSPGAVGAGGDEIAKAAKGKGKGKKKKKKKKKPPAPPPTPPSPPAPPPNPPPPPPPPPPNPPTGTVLFTERNCFRDSASGQTPAGSTAPLDGATVRLIPDAGPEIEKVLDQSGNFYATLAPGQTYDVFVRLDSTKVSVGPDTSPSPPYEFQVGELSPLNPSSTFVIGGGTGSTLAEPAEGAANIFSTLQKGARFVQGAPVTIPKVHARWRYNAALTGWLGNHTPSQYDESNDNIIVGGEDPPNKRDEYEKYPLLHEYGHHVLDQVASPGATATGTHSHNTVHPTVPALPWSEGFADALAALATDNPELTLGCHKRRNFAAEPATARGTHTDPLLPMPNDPAFPNQGQHLAQYNETAITGALWGLTNHFGNGDRKAGFISLLGAFKTFNGAYNGPHSFREARDALIQAGLEADVTKHQQLTELLAKQRIGWGLEVFAYTANPTIPNHNAFLYLSTQGPAPYGTCDENGTDTPYGDPQYTYMGGVVGAEGSLGYAWQDECYTASAPGSPTEGQNSIDIPYPAPGDRADPEATFTVTARGVCFDANGSCPGTEQWRINVSRGPFVSPGTWNCSSGAIWCYEIFNSGYSQVHTFTRNASVPIIEFDALGRCKVVLDNPDTDCGV